MENKEMPGLGGTGQKNSQNPDELGKQQPDINNLQFCQGSIFEAACAYAEHGLPVFPCKTDKAPLTDHGFKDATTDIDQIKKWWAQWPNASIGMPTGETSGLWVLDADTYKPEGLESYNQLTKEYGPLPNTRSQATGGGGEQYFFNFINGPIPSSNGKIAPGLDIKADGGYVILPPSNHPSGNKYQWDNEGPVADAPEWLLKLAKEAKKPEPTCNPLTPGSPSTNSPYGLKALENEVQAVRAAPEGTRNDTLNKAAFALGQLIAGGELSESLVWTTLSDVALATGLGQIEVERTLKSGLDAGKLNPRTPRDDTCDSGIILPSSQETSTGAANDSNDGCDGFPGERTTIVLPQPPLEVFHPEIREAIENIAATKVTPIEVCISGALALSSGLICRSRGITIKVGWSEKGNMFIGLVGRSSCGKSPAINSIFKQIYVKEKQYQEEFKNQMEAYNMALQEWKGRKKDAPPEPKPEPPVRVDLILDDWTIEAAADSLAANPRGLLLYRDELAGMLLELDKYSGEKGATKTRLMTAYDGSKPWKISRVNADRSNYIPEPCVSLYGGIQPSIAKDLFNKKDMDSGFLGRFIFIQAIQKNPAIFSEQDELPQTHDTLKKLINGLNSFSFDGNTKFIQVSPEAKETFIKWHDGLACEAWFSENDGVGSLLNKIRAQGLRICLNLHCMDAVMNENDEMQPVNNETMVRALKLMDWMGGHTQATWKMLMSQAAAPSGHDVRVAQSILRLEDKIKNSWLSTSEIADMANEGLDTKFHMSTEQVGKACTRLDLEKKAKSHARGFIITPQDLERLNSLLPLNKQSYPSYPSETGNGGGSEHDTSKSEPSYPSYDVDEGVPI